MPKRDWCSYCAVIGGVIAFLLGVAAAYWTAVAQFTPGPVPSGIQAKAKKQEQDPGDSAVASNQQKANEYRPGCEPPNSKEDGLYCELRRLADSAKKSIALASETNWSQLIQAGAAILAALVAGWAALEAGRAAKAATKSADVSERALRGIERPYLFVKIESVRGLKRATLDTPSKPTLAYNIINQGKTPAILRSLAVRLQDSPTDRLRLPMGLASKFYEVVAAGEYVSHPSGGRIVEVEGSAGGQRYDDATIQRLVFHGSIHYEDPTGAYHTDRFCMRANKDGAFSLEGGEEYNHRSTAYPEKQAADDDYEG